MSITIITDQMNSFKKESICLIKLNNETNQLQLTVQGRKFLQSLSNPIAVITIAGLYRTGKSFLINNLVPRQQSTGAGNAIMDWQTEPFKIGTTTQSMTKGLSILATPITLRCLQTGQNIDYLLVDSQGIGSCDRNAKYDMDLLILIFLISSTVVYNSIGAIDEQSLQQLQVVLKLKGCVENVKHQYDSCSFKYLSPPPKFCWVLRDFALQLIDKNGKQMTSDEYLQQCLEQSASTSSQSRKKNQLRKAIKQNLGQRHCYTLVRPTINEQDLQTISHYNYNHYNSSLPSYKMGGGKNAKVPKLRSEFIDQLEYLKQTLFSGKNNDIKRINGEEITGRVFVRILSQYLRIINRGELPRVADVWNSVVKINYEQYFQQLMDQLIKQIKAIKLPLPKQQLKLRTNQIENKIYKNLEIRIQCEGQFKAYHKQFLKQIQKLNKEVKERNDDARKNNLMGQLHKFVKQNLNYQTLKPSNISESMKQFVERIKIKINGDQFGYEYLLGLINDVFFIVEQKSAKIQRQYAQLKHSHQSIVLDKNNLDLTLMNLKRQYHQSLKTIARLQQGQAEIDKNYTLTKNKIMNYETKIMKLETDMKSDKQNYQKTNKQIQEKSKNKIDQLTGELKKVKQINLNLEEQVARYRQKIKEKELITKKENIFEEKIRESYDKFNEERIMLKKQIETYKKQIGTVNQKYKELKDLYQKQVQIQRTAQQNYLKKQQNFMKQFENLKQCVKATKASFQQTSQTMISSDQVLKEVNNYIANTAKKDKFQTPGKQGRTENKQQPNDRATMKRFYENQMQKMKQDHSIQIKKHQERILFLEQQKQKLRIQSTIHQRDSKQYKQRCLKLEGDINLANSKFNQFLKQIETAKQKQRSLYEQSIIRLLNNIQKKERDSMASSGAEERLSSASTNNYNQYKKNRASEHITGSISFGNVFRTG